MIVSPEDKLYIFMNSRKLGLIGLLPIDLKRDLRKKPKPTLKHKLLVPESIALDIINNDGDTPSP